MAEPHRRPWTSFLALRSSQRGALVVLLLVAGAAPFPRGSPEARRDAFLDQTTRRWCQVYGKRDDLQVVTVDVRFRAEPPLFAEGDGIVVAPVAIDLPRSQRLLEVASEPAHLRKLTAQRVTAVAWEYAGRLHRDMRFLGIALVERAPLARPLFPGPATFDGLAPELRAEASARAALMEEHGLEKCAAFPAWARGTAGSPPHTEQILRLVRAVAHWTEVNQNEPEDLCAAIRMNRFTPHRAQVAVVMGAREVGIPTFGFASASPRAIYLVGTYTDHAGWVLVDVERPGDGWFAGGPALLTMAPLLGGFSASRHGHWSPEGGAYAKGDWGVTSLSRTEWRGLPSAEQPARDTTEAQARRLSEVCP